MAHKPPYTTIRKVGCMMKWLRRVAHFTIRFLVLGACGLISIFLLMSGYESIYNRSLPFVHTLDPVNISVFSATYALRASSYDDSKLLGSFGRPQNLKLPDRDARLTVTAPLRQQDGAWLSRANALHMLIPSAPRDGNIGIALLYCRSSFRTLNEQNLPKPGSNIFMDTDKNWRYVYKVSSARVFDDNVPYVVSDTGANSELIITCNDTGRHQNVIVEARLLSVQGVDN